MIERSLPIRHPVAGVGVSATDYDGATEAVVAAAKARRTLLVTALAVHGLTVGATDPEIGRALAAFDVVTPDGQPVRWALNLLHRTGLRDRVYGPNLMLRVCTAAEREGVGIYLYGSRPETLAKLRASLTERFPRLRIAGWRPSRFRADTPEEDADDVRTIVESGAGIVFVGLGCPRQERWAYLHRDRIPLPMLCVGAAFDFHAGTVRQAPGWMQARGLEWLFRLAVEPRRLWKRYLGYNPLFVALVARQLLTQRFLNVASTAAPRSDRTIEADPSATEASRCDASSSPAAAG